MKSNPFYNNTPKLKYFGKNLIQLAQDIYRKLKKSKNEIKEEIKGSRIASTKLKDKVGKLTLLDFSAYDKAVGIKAAHYWR